MSDHDPLHKWQTRVDREIDKIQDAALNHPGAGKPLKLIKQAGVPDDMQMAFKILAENDLAPDWIMLGKTLEQKAARLRGAIERAAAEYKGRRFANSEELWHAKQRKFREDSKAYNNEVLGYNLKVPRGIPHRPLFDLDREVARALTAI